MSDFHRAIKVRHCVSFLIVVLLSGVVWAAVSTPEHQRADPLLALDPQLVTKRPAPDFELPDREGRLHRLTEHRGRPVVLNFWSVDCPPCLRELPGLSRLAGISRERGDFSVLSVSVDRSWRAVSRVFRGEPELLVLFDPERDTVQERYGTERFPETFLIDADGEIRARIDGPRDWSNPDVLDAIDSL